MTDRQRAGAYGVSGPITEVNVLYVDDVGSTRVAFVAFHLENPDPSTSWANASAWFVARPGASAAELASPASTAGIGQALQPFEIRSNPGSPGAQSAGVVIGLAPAGCVVESPPLPALDAWAPEPTGSYVVRTAATERAQWWRVVCAGVVKEVRPAETARSAGPLTEPQLDSALAAARGRVDRNLARDAITSTVDSANRVTGPARVVWGGRVTGVRNDVDGTAVVAAAPWVGGGRQLSLDIRHDQPGPEGPNDTGVRTWVSDDPGDPTAILPVRLGEGFSMLLVVPDGVTSVRAVRDGVVLDTAEVTDQAAVVDAPGAEKVLFEALDRHGTVVATTGLPLGAPPRTDVSSW